jgi:hypothetical protein
MQKEIVSHVRFWNGREVATLYEAHFCPRAALYLDTSLLILATHRPFLGEDTVKMAGVCSFDAVCSRLKNRTGHPVGSTLELLYVSRSPSMGRDPSQNAEMGSWIWSQTRRWKAARRL